MELQHTMNGYIIFRIQNFNQKAKGRFSFNMYSTKLFLNVIPDQLEKPKTGSMNFQGVILVLKSTQKLQVNLNKKQEEYFRLVKLESDQVGRKTQMSFNLLWLPLKDSNAFPLENKFLKSDKVLPNFDYSSITDNTAAYALKC